jgi:hypothetical protein
VGPKGSKTRRRSNRLATAPRGGPRRIAMYDHSTDAHVLDPQHPIALRASLGDGPPPLDPGHRPSLLPTTHLRGMLTADVEPLIPATFAQVAHSPLRGECELAHIQELQDCINRDVFGPPTYKEDDWIVVTLTWTYAMVSRGGRYHAISARVALLGNQSKSDLSPWAPYTPVAQVATGRILIAMHLGTKGIRFRKINTQTALINENMRRTVYTTMPPGFRFTLGPTGDIQFSPLEAGETSDPNLCLPLNKALYGGMESGRVFWEAWTDWHLQHGFALIHEERCFLLKRGHNGDFIKIVYDAHDNMVGALGTQFYADYLEQLMDRFDVTEGPLTESLV